MAAAENAIKENSLKANQAIFLLCDQCLWTVTCFNKKYLEELSEISNRVQLPDMQSRPVV